jgi:serine protease Do
MQKLIQQAISQRKAVAATMALAAVLMTVAVAATSVATSTSDQTGHRPAIAAVNDLSNAFRDVSNRVLPSVVTIQTKPSANDTAQSAPKSDTPQGEGDDRNPHQGNPFEGTPFGDMFRGGPFGKGFRFEAPPTKPHHRGGGSGSGVVIDASGLILTNNHVVAGGGNVTVRLHDGREFEAVEVLTDPKTDLAVVRIAGASRLTAATLGNSDHVEVGDWVLALGQPFGLESTVTAGIISAKHRGIGITARENFLQTDAAINPGNSGGPLVNLRGEVIGINTAISSRGGGNDGIGFAVPANMVRWVTEQLTSDGVVRRAYLGVGIQPITAELAEQFKVQPRQGVVVTQVRPDTPAAAAGLQSGDVIVEFAGTPITAAGQLQLVVERAEIGTRHDLVIVRDGERMTLALEPQEQPTDMLADQSGHSPQHERTRLDTLGVKIGELEPSVARKLGLEDVTGVVVTDVRAGSAAEQAGVQSGNVITQVNGQTVTSVADVNATLAAEPDAESTDAGVLLLIRTATGSRFVVVG